MTDATRILAAHHAELRAKAQRLRTSAARSDAQHDPARADMARDDADHCDDVADALETLLGTVPGVTIPDRAQLSLLSLGNGCPA